MQRNNELVKQQHSFPGAQLNLVLAVSRYILLNTILMEHF